MMLTSGLVVEGVAWAQLAVLAAVLGLALWRFGALRLWAVALAAHVGSALLAYAAVGVLCRLVDASLVRRPRARLRHLRGHGRGARRPRRRRDAAGTALLVGLLALAGFGIGLADASALANAEHLLAFALGALTILLLDRRWPRPAPAYTSAPCGPSPSATASSSSPSTPIPSRATGEVLVRVRAAGLNGADMLQLRGRATRRRPASPADIPGLELAGEVVALGPGASASPRATA